MKDYKYINTNDYVELLASGITMQEIFDNGIIVKYN